MRTEERLRIARQSDPDWWARWDAHWAGKLDRSPEGQAAHNALCEAYRTRLETVADDGE